MTLILAGRLAATIQRLDGVTNESISGLRCQEILAHSYPSVADLRKLRYSLCLGRARQVFRHRGFVIADEHLQPADQQTNTVAWGIANQQGFSRQPAGQQAGMGRKDPADPGDSGSLPDDELAPSEEPRLTVVVGMRKSVRVSPTLCVRHCAIPLPDDALRRVSPDLGLGAETYVAAPSLIWLLEAVRLSLPRTIERGMELCGTYATSNEPIHSASYHLSPATTPLALGRGIETLAAAATTGRVFGLSRCRAALPYVLANAASPMESKVATLLSLPVTRGGWGLGALALNDRVELTEAQRAIADLPYLSIDGRVVGHDLGYEYDSAEFHEAAPRESRDRARLAAAQALGITLLPLTWDIVRDEARFSAFCDELTRLAGKRQRPCSQRTLGRRAALRRELGLPCSVPPAPQAGESLVPLEVYEAEGPYLTR